MQRRRRARSPDANPTTPGTAPCKGKRSSAAPEAYACYWESFPKWSAMPGKLTKNWFTIAALGFALSTLPCVALARTPSPPTIDLLRPDLSRPLRNPVAIYVRFSASPGREINMRSFRATYGRLRIDITRRILRYAVVSRNSLSAANVDLPTGNHQITLSIADTGGKRASRTFRFSVTR